MQLHFYSNVLFVKDIEKAKGFYTGILGIPVEIDFGKNVQMANGLTLWEVFPEQVIPQKLGMPALHDENVNRFELCFEADDLPLVEGELKAAGVTFLHELQEEPWGQYTVRFFDPDRHLIEIGEPLEVFVRRQAAKGLSAEQVAQKTGTPLEKVREILKS